MVVMMMPWLWLIDAKMGLDGCFFDKAAWVIRGRALSGGGLSA